MALRILELNHGIFELLGVGARKFCGGVFCPLGGVAHWPSTAPDALAVLAFPVYTHRYCSYGGSRWRVDR